MYVLYVYKLTTFVVVVIAEKRRVYDSRDETELHGDDEFLFNGFQVSLFCVLLFILFTN